MILVIDIGNSNITFGIFDGDELVKRFRAPSNICRLDSAAVRDPRFSGAETTEYCYLDLTPIEENADGLKIDGAIVASVVTGLDYEYKAALDKRFCIDTLVLTPETPLNLDIKLDNPLEVGADRIANAMGILEKFGQNAIVVDFGTATTFEVVTQKREFIGGLITTGLHMQLNSLSAKTSKLPHIELYPPKHAVATNTVDAILSGIVLGNACMIDGMIKKFREELAPEEYIVVATGGFASFIEGYMKGSFDYILPDLTLEGLLAIYKSCNNKTFTLKSNHGIG